MSTVSIGIKALNEEGHIAGAIASAQAAIAALPAGMTGQIVVADSGSTDATVAIARAVPGVRVVQLADSRQRCCGAGAQLAWQAADGDWFYLLDGDMILDPGFLAQGIAFLQSHPEHAGIGGRVNEVNTQGIEFEMRKRTDRYSQADAAALAEGTVEDVDRLDCGGLYRASAVRALGYFADRNLHAFEEFELGARLRAAGWRLARINIAGVDHFGHIAPVLRLLWRRLRSGYAGGAGEVVRAALGRPHARVVARQFVQPRYAVVVIGWWLGLLLAALATAPLALVLLMAAPFAVLSLRHRSLRMGVYLVALWNMQTLAFIQGVLRRRSDPRTPLAMIDLTADAAAALQSGTDA